MKPIIILLVAIVLFSSCTQKENTEEKSTEPAIENTVTFSSAQIKNAGIVTGKIQQQAVASILKVNGKIDVPPQNLVSISVPMGGYLKTTKLLPGLHVYKGDVIAVMEDQQYIQLQQDYLTAKVKAGLLENEYLRQKELNSSKAGSDKIFQQAEADYSSQKILVTSLSEKLKLAGINVNNMSESNISRSVNVYSPINGFVSKVNVNIGKYVSPTEVLFELINPTDIHLTLKIFEKDLDKLFIGQKLIAYTNNEPEKKHACEILLIGKDLNAERNTEVHCHFDDYDKTLIPGTYMNADIEIKSKNSFVLPEDAIVSFENKRYAFVTKSGSSFEMVEVQTGNSENGFTEILQPASLSGQTFVIKGTYSLLMSLKNKSEE